MAIFLDEGSRIIVQGMTGAQGRKHTARMLAAGMSNEQIAARLGFRDKRTISRTNGQIYAAWGLADSAADEMCERSSSSRWATRFPPRSSSTARWPSSSPPTRTRCRP